MIYYKVKLKVTFTNYFMKPFETKLYIYILDVTSNIKDKHKDFINLRHGIAVMA